MNNFVTYVMYHKILSIDTQKLQLVTLTNLVRLDTGFFLTLGNEFMEF